MFVLKKTAAIALLLFASAHAQVTSAQLRDQLERGLYSSAARVTGPALVLALPDDAEARYLFSKALYLVGDTAEAERQLSLIPAAAELASAADYHHLAGLLIAAAGDANGALPELARAFELSRSYLHAMDWALIAWQAQDHAVALQVYSLAAATERGHREPWPYLNQGRLLLIMERFQEAINAFEEAIRVFEATDTGDGRPSPAYVEAFYRLGLIHQRLYEQNGSAEERRLAENHYQAALSADPNYMPALAALEAFTRGE